MFVDEVEVSRIKTLERITVAGLQSIGKEDEEEVTTVVNVILYNNEYYCVDDPLLLQGKDNKKKKVKVRVIAEAKDLNEVYDEYIRNNTRNILNPYQLLLLYKQRKIRNLPIEVHAVIARNLPINDDLLLMLNNQLLEIEKKYKGKPIFITITVLDAISQILQYIEKGLAKEEVLRIIDEYLKDYKEEPYVQYPTPLQLVALVEGLVIEEEEEKKIEEERRHIEELRKRKMQGSQSVVYQAEITHDTIGEIKSKVTELLKEEKEEEGEKEEEKKKGISIAVSVNGISGNSVDKEVIDDVDDNARRIRRTETIKNTLLMIKLSYPTRIEDVINRIINRFINELERNGVVVSKV